MSIPWPLAITLTVVFSMIGVILACTTQASSANGDFNSKRRAMVKQQLQLRDISEPAVLKAMEEVPRHAFVPDDLKGRAYADCPLPIGNGQTISQPYIVAYMTQALRLKKRHKVLEIGTGSGYQAAILAAMGVDVYSIEIIEPLGKRAKETLDSLGYKVHLKIGDGYHGWPKAAPFDGVIVTAAPERIPEPLVEQLKEGGRMVIPVGASMQTLEVYTKVNGKLVLGQTLPVRFVPMTGQVQEGVR